MRPPHVAGALGGALASGLLMVRHPPSARGASPVGSLLAGKGDRPGAAQSRSDSPNLAGCTPPAARAFAPRPSAERAQVFTWCTPRPRDLRFASLSLLLFLWCCEEKDGTSLKKKKKDFLSFPPERFLHWLVFLPA